MRYEAIKTQDMEVNIPNTSADAVMAGHSTNGVGCKKHIQ